jgi:hypothetical protein
VQTRVVMKGSESFGDLHSYCHGSPVARALFRRRIISAIRRALGIHPLSIRHPGPLNAVCTWRFVACKTISGGSWAASGSAAPKKSRAVSSASRKLHSRATMIRSSGPPPSLVRPNSLDRSRLSSGADLMLAEGAVHWHETKMSDAYADVKIRARVTRRLEGPSGEGGDRA